jgi:hypothetical protein
MDLIDNMRHSYRRWDLSDLSNVFEKCGLGPIFETWEIGHSTKSRKGLVKATKDGADMFLHVDMEKGRYMQWTENFSKLCSMKDLVTVYFLYKSGALGR